MTFDPTQHGGISAPPQGCTCLTTVPCRIHPPNGWKYSDSTQGRTPEHQARNEQACGYIIDAIMVLFLFGADVYLLERVVGAWLVATVAGW